MTVMTADRAAALASGDIKDFCHTGPDTLAGRFLRRFWQPVRRVEDLKVGWAVPARVMGEDLTLFRTASGRFCLLSHRCAHRGTRLSTGIVDGEGLRCAYHGWKYDERGQCVDQPSEPCSFAKDVKIKSYPCQEYLSLVFAYLGPGEPPPLPRFPHFEDSGVVVSHSNHWPFNYFQHLENAVDEVHIGFLHATSPYQSTINRQVPLISSEEAAHGLIQYGERSGVKRATYYIMPNASSWAQPSAYPEELGWRDMIGWRVPADDQSHITYTVTHANVPDEKREDFLRHRREEIEELASLPPFEEIADKVLRGEMRFVDIPYRGNGADMTRIQDRVIMMGQGGIVAREHETLGQADNAIVLLRKVWERELTALRDDKPLTNWVQSSPPPSSGV